MHQEPLNEQQMQSYKIGMADLINDRYIVLNKGKRNTYIIKVV